MKTRRNIIIDVEAFKILKKEAYEQEVSMKDLASKAIKAMKWDDKQA